MPLLLTKSNWGLLYFKSIIYVSAYIYVLLKINEVQSDIFIMEPKSIAQKVVRMQYLPLSKERKSDVKKSFQTYSVSLEYIDGFNQVFFQLIFCIYYSVENV